MSSAVGKACRKEAWRGFRCLFPIIMVGIVALLIHSYSASQVSSWTDEPEMYFSQVKQVVGRYPASFTIEDREQIVRAIIPPPEAELWATVVHFRQNELQRQLIVTESAVLVVFFFFLVWLVVQAWPVVVKARLETKCKVKSDRVGTSIFYRQPKTGIQARFQLIGNIIMITGVMLSILGGASLLQAQLHVALCAALFALIISVVAGFYAFNYEWRGIYAEDEKDITFDMRAFEKLDVFIPVQFWLLVTAGSLVLAFVVFR